LWRTGHIKADCPNKEGKENKSSNKEKKGNQLLGMKMKSLHQVMKKPICV